MPLDDVETGECANHEGETVPENTGLDEHPSFEVNTDWEGHHMVEAPVDSMVDTAGATGGECPV